MSASELCIKEGANRVERKRPLRKFEAASRALPAKRAKQHPIYVVHEPPAKPSSPENISIELPGSPSSVGKIRRSTREVFRSLLAKLDAVLPVDQRSTPRPNGAGSRSLGSAGRSIHDVLSDAVRAVAARRSERDHEAVLRPNGSMAIEVEMPGCIVTAMSPGAELFFKHAPWGSVEGQSLADFVQWEDLDDFDAMCQCPTVNDAPEGQEKRRIRLQRWEGFNKMEVDCSKVVPLAQYAAHDQDRCLVPQDSESDYKDVFSVGSTFGCSAFEDDPLLFDQPELDHATPLLRCEYVAAEVQALRMQAAVSDSAMAVSPVSHRVLVTLSLL